VGEGEEAIAGSRDFLASIEFQKEGTIETLYTIRKGCPYCGTENGIEVNKAENCKFWILERV
jgi:hypothetical protein